MAKKRAAKKKESTSNSVSAFQQVLDSNENLKQP